MWTLCDIITISFCLNLHSVITNSEAYKTLEIDNTVLKPSTVVRNLGVLLDEQLSVDANARQRAKTCFFHLRRIRQLCRHVDY